MEKPSVACREDHFEPALRISSSRSPRGSFRTCIAHLKFPLGHRLAIRTTNLLERLFGEERRRTK
jgi:transposase-like protein